MHTFTNGHIPFCTGIKTISIINTEKNLHLSLELVKCGLEEELLYSLGKILPATKFDAFTYCAQSRNALIPRNPAEKLQKQTQDLVLKSH